MENGDKILTTQGHQKVKDELEYLKTTRLPELAKRIAEAKELGDLSENAEYQEAKDEQGIAARRIIELENILRMATVLDTSGVNLTEVEIGNKVIVKVDGKSQEYEIVGASEADPLTGKISNESPLGQALLGKIRGNVVEVEVPKGKMKFTIVDIK